MFVKIETTPAFDNPIQLDVTSPSLSKHRQDDYPFNYYYQEKIILTLLQLDSITEREYQKLYALVHLPIPEAHSIAKDSWLPITALSNFELFKTQEKEIKASLALQFSLIRNNAHFIYKTTKNKFIYLLEKDMQRLETPLTAMLCESMRKGFFTLEDVLEMETQLRKGLLDYAKQSIQSDDFKMIFEFCAGIGQHTIVDTKSFAIFQNYSRSLKEIWPQLIQSIIKMRFNSEFNELTFDDELNKNLEKKIFRSHVRLHGLSLLKNPINKIRCERIVQVLNELLFEETQADEIKRLIFVGADLNVRNAERRTPLNEAMLLKQEDKALLLLSLGADPDIVSYHVQGYSNLMVALCAELSYSFILELINKSKNLDYKNQLGETALILALKIKASGPIITKLIHHTKDLNTKNKLGYSALDFAIHDCPRTHCSDTIKNLVNAGASTLVPNDDGNFPLIESASCSNPAVLKYIFHISPQLINEQNNKGETALFVAMKQENYIKETCEILDFLIKHGANPSATTKEGSNAFILAKRHSQLNAQLEKALQELANESLSQEMLTAFITSLSRIAENKTHRLASAANLLLKRYLSFLHGLEGNNTPRSNASFLAQIVFLQKQGDFSVSYLSKIIQDIMIGGEGHKTLFLDKPDLIDRFSRMVSNAGSNSAQKLPQQLRTGRSFIDSHQLSFGESAYLFTKLDEFLKKEKLELGEDFAFILSDPRFWALPKSTLKLMYENQSLCKELIRDWGLSYEQLRELNQKKLDIFSRFKNIICNLKQSNLPLKELVRFDEDRLNLLFENPAGLLVLIELGLSFERLRKIEINQLNLWLENPLFFQFLLKHKLNVSSILTVDRAKFNLLSGQIERLEELMESDIAFDSIIQLSFEQLHLILTGKVNERESLEASLLMIPQARLC